jgi:xanthine dehydrogenase accessory factor
MTGGELLLRAEELRSGRTPFVLATVVRAERPTSAKPGDSALVLPDGTIEGFVGGSCAESTVRAQGLRLLKTGESTLLRITPTPGGEQAGGTGERAAGGTVTAGAVLEGMVTVPNPCLSGGTLDIFLDANLPPLLVHVYGHAPVARALVDIGKALGYDVRSVASTAPLPADLTAVVVALHGRDEEPVLTAATRAGVPYIGLVASPRRGAAVLAALHLTGEQRASVHTPAGLDIGARTPAEIALSVYAEIVALRPRCARVPEPAVAQPQSTRSAVARPGSARPEPAQLEPTQLEPTQLEPTQPAVAEAVDPVCGMTIAVTAATPSTSHDGQPMYFCGPGCQHAFTDDPTRYV